MGLVKLFLRKKPKIKIQTVKKDSFSGWIKCQGCNEMIHHSELSENEFVCNKCGFHYRMSAPQRVAHLIDKGTFQEVFSHLESRDPLRFADELPYTERLAASQEKTGRKDAIITGTGKINGEEVYIGVFDFTFMGGSMGTVVGEKITLIIEAAIKEKVPVVIVSASGGARMQESIFSLMQMAKTSMALSRLHEAKLPFISILTNPTTGGVTASFASLGDVILAEPKALIGFAGPRVVEQTTRQKLPENAQKSEFVLEKGMIDMVVPRKEMKAKVTFFLRMLRRTR
ncbi:MAG: acetyl-CoA carboxylase subunit beta [Chlamydiae bacterium RIFCSPHIGHO2_12_FULL_49_11]|nr:MAG: acetyl-CoA carboxylase subunit beta [Chlamydiae bacterium RIFCSPHIGHO2_12_FULL_49_11]